MGSEIHVTYVGQNWLVSWHSVRKISEHNCISEALVAATNKVKSLPWGEVTCIKKVEGKLIQTLWSYHTDGFPPAEIGQHEFLR